MDPSLAMPAPSHRAASRPRAVVGVGESPSGTAALARAAALCRERGWLLDVVTAWPDAGEVLVHDVPGHYCEPRGRAALAQRRALEACGVRPGPDVRVHLVNGDPVSSLAAIAHGAQLVMVGASAGGRSRLRGHEGLGDACRRLCRCPVLVVGDPRAAPRRTA